MSTPNSNEPQLDIAGGDRALSEHLKSSLKILKDKSDDAEFRRLVDEVIAGRASLRDAAMSPVFANAVNPRVEQFAERYEQLSEAELEELAQQGTQQFALRNEQIDRERAAASSRPDDDDNDDRRYLV